MSKRLMILGAGRGQVPLIRTARRMGLTTVVATASDDFPGVPIADEVCHVDIAQPEQVYEVAKAARIDGMAISCLDTGIEALGYACDRLGLRGLSYQAARLCRNKLLMKDALCQCGVRTARYRQVSSEQDLMSALEDFDFPVVIKAVSLQGSRGIYIVRSAGEAIRGLEQAMAAKGASPCIVEEYIDGYECGAQAFVQDGEIVFVLPHGDRTIMSHAAVPAGHYAPLETETSIADEVVSVTRGAIRALELDNCAVNVDLMIRGGKAYIIELTGRVGATCLPELVSIWYGIDYYRMIIAGALGEDPRAVFDGRAKAATPNASRMLKSDRSGVVRKIENRNSPNDSRIHDLSFFIAPGSQVRKFSDANDFIGQVVVSGDDVADCEMKIDVVLSNVTIAIE